MAEDAEMANAPEGEGDEQEPEEDLPLVSLEIFNTIKSSHALHGLRHGDHQRYRQYCSRRLHRVRKSLGFLHGKGRYQKRALEPRAVREDRHLLLPLYCAERSWAYAMALKRDVSDDTPRPRFHMLNRLSKAAQWSSALSYLCASRADKRTALEADAYMGYMHGNFELEREEWEAAAAHLRKTRTILRELCRVSMADQSRLYKQVIAEVEPSIRFCAYNVQRFGLLAGNASELEADMMGEGDVDDLLEGDTEGVGDILRGKLEAVMHESRARKAEDFNEVEVLGEMVPIRSEMVPPRRPRARSTPPLPAPPPPPPAPTHAPPPDPTYAPTHAHPAPTPTPPGRCAWRSCARSSSCSPSRPPPPPPPPRRPRLPARARARSRTAC